MIRHHQPYSIVKSILSIPAYLRAIALVQFLALPAPCPAGEAPALSVPQVTELARLQSQNRNREAAEFLEKHIGQAEPRPKQLMDLCLAYTFSGQFRKMQACYDKLQHLSPDGRVVEKMPWGATVVDNDYTSTAYFIMMKGYALVGDFDRAIASGQRALSSIKAPESYSGKKETCSILGGLGVLHAREGNRAKAEEYLQHLRKIDPAVKVDPAIQAKDPDAAPYFALGVSISINMALYEIYRTLGDFGEALAAFDLTDPSDSPVYQRKYAGREEQFREIDEFAKAARSAARANLMVELGRLAEAQPLYDIAFAHPRLQYLISYWSSLYQRGILADKLGRSEEAIQFYRRAVDEIERQRASIDKEAGKIGFIGDKQAVYGRLVDALIRTRQDSAAFDYVERAKARALVDLLANRELQAAAGEATLTLAKVAQLQNALSAQGGSDPKAIENVQRTRSQLSEATAQLRQSAPQLASLVTVSHVGEAQLRALLQPDETLVEYYGAGDTLYAFVATPATVRAVRLDGRGLGEAVRAFRAAVQNPQSRDVAAQAARLHARLIAPLNLPAQGKLLIVPHGILHYLPFNALATGKDYLVDRYSIRFLPSASVLAFLGQRPAGGQGLLILGNPDLGSPEYDLPGAQKEAEEIAKLRPDARLLLRADASKSAVTREAGQYAYLHFASHGKFDAARPLQSGLYLAGDPAGGTLTVDDLYALKLNAELVTLSACETALGRIDNGDDVIGLTRGFFYAGAASVIASLWAVDDDATYLMMTRFYRELGAASKADALLKAQRAVKARFPHPFYWAAFQLSGRR